MEDFQWDLSRPTGLLFHFFNCTRLLQWEDFSFLLLGINRFEYQTHFLQCPHQGAKNSTSHTSSLSNTNLSKLSSVSSTTSFLFPPLLLPPPPLCYKPVISYINQLMCVFLKLCDFMQVQKKKKGSLPVCSQSHQICRSASLSPGYAERSWLHPRWPGCCVHLRGCQKCKHNHRKKGLESYENNTLLNTVFCTGLL